MSAPAQPRLQALSAGRLTEVVLPGQERLEYFAYRPRSLAPNRPLLVFVHGYARRAEAHARALVPLCEQLGCALLAPFFTRDDHPRYQRLGRGPDGQRADRVLDACIDDLLGPGNAAFNLAGFSGGAQFAHRYAMAHPERIERLVAVAAGWYTIPDLTVRYPYGLHTQRTLRGYSLNPERFLAVPTTVIVGADDTGSHNLRRSASLDAQQGCTRVERARNWVAHMRVAARDHRMPSAVDYIEVPGIGHDFEEFMAHGHLSALLGRVLARPERAAEPSVDQPMLHPARPAAPKGELTRHASP